MKDKELVEIFSQYGIKVSTNRFNLRVVVNGNMALGEKRLCREGDFRASGSVHFEYTSIREDVLNIAFQTAKVLGMQSVAFDFIFSENKPKIIEMSYGFGTHGISHSPGYYTDDMQWHPTEGPIDFCGWQIENLIKELS